jgi:hypothetical protein
VTAARPAPQYCHRCQKLTTEPVLVDTVHGASLGGRNIWACPQHAPARRKAHGS